MAAGTAAQFAPGVGANASPAGQQQPAIPFVQAAKQGRQPASNATYVPGASQQNWGPLPLPASGGYLRRLHIEAVFTGGSAGTLTADAPWNALGEVRLLEPNNTPIVDLSGYNLFLSNIYGGYDGVNDPRNDPDYSVSTANAPVFEVYIPIELDTTGVGALADLSSSSAFQLYVAIAPQATIWSAITGNPSGAFSTFQDYWTLPNPTDQDNRPQATAPPYPGTIQLWSQIPNIVIASNQRVQLNRMGNQLRTIIMVGRSAGARAEGAVPNPLAVRWDDIIILNSDLQTVRKTMREYVNGMTARDTGVYALPFSFGVSRFVGGNGISSYLPTVTATRYEISGPNTASTPTVDWIVNEVSSAPISAVARTSVGGGVQYYPPAPAPGGPGVM
jgi:hypothetical protein